MSLETGLSDEHKSSNQQIAQSVTNPQADRDMHDAIAQLTTGDFHSKWDSAKQFSKRTDDWGDRPIPLLIQRLQTEPDPENQGFLIRALSQFDQASVIEAIAQQLVTTAAESVQTEATKALTALGKSAISTLAVLLESDRLSQKILAARALSRIRRTPVIDPLLSVAAHENSELRAIALEALGSFHDPRIVPLLIAATADELPIAQEAIRALGRRSDLGQTVDLVSPLSRTLRSPHEAVAKESAIALGRLGTPNAIVALSNLLSQPRPTSVKIVAIRALGWIGNLPAVEALAEAFDYDAPMIMPDVQQAIARSLSQVEAEELKAIAIPPLLRWIATQNAPARIETFTLKQSVITALARLSAHSALDDLIQALSDPDPRIRIHILSALKQIDPKAAQTKIQTHLTDPAMPSEQRQLIIESLSAW